MNVVRKPARPQSIELNTEWIISERIILYSRTHSRTPQRISVADKNSSVTAMPKDISTGKRTRPNGRLAAKRDRKEKHAIQEPQCHREQPARTFACGLSSPPLHVSIVTLPNAPLLQPSASPALRDRLRTVEGRKRMNHSRLGSSSIFVSKLLFAVFAVCMASQRSCFSTCTAIASTYSMVA